MKMPRRPRRNRKSPTVRELVRETRLHASQLVWPIFLKGGKKQREEIPSMPGVYRYSLDNAVGEIETALALGVKSVALFPKIDSSLKDDSGSEALNSKGLIYESIRQIKQALPEISIITDVALDPFTSHGHDGLVKDGKILNDQTVKVLRQMALLQADSGADYVAPSDMMDGRVGVIRQALDDGGFEDTGIIAYTAKYASAFYGPFRDAVGSKLSFGDKRTYQMDTCNAREALLEAELDIKEGADILLVKPALSYMDIINRLKRKFPLPIGAYNVSGEYSMVKAAVEKGWVEEEKVVMEILLSLRRAGADMIFTYHARDAAKWLKPT